MLILFLITSFVFACVFGKGGFPLFFLGGVCLAVVCGWVDSVVFVGAYILKVIIYYACQELSLCPMWNLSESRIQKEGLTGITIISRRLSLLASVGTFNGSKTRTHWILGALKIKFAPESNLIVLLSSKYERHLDLHSFQVWISLNTSSFLVK